MQNTTTNSNQATDGKPVKFTGTLSIPTYSCKVVVIVTDYVEKEAKRIIKKHKLQDKWGEGEAEGAVLTADLDLYYFLLSGKFLTHNTIAHEIHHVVCRVTSDRGITDEESRSWLSGHVAEFLYKFLDKKMLIVTHE
jgi:hypothetical protein